MNDLLTSIVRTAVPLIAGWLLTQAARLGVTLDDATTTSFVAMAVSAVYYTVARALEQRKARFGLLLGVPKPPTY